LPEVVTLSRQADIATAVFLPGRNAEAIDGCLTIWCALSD
jgi:hypothetical protein